MNWKAVLAIALSTAIAGLVVGLMIGMRGCDGGVNKLLQENAELKVQVTRHRFLAGQAEEERAKHAVQRNTAERALAATETREAAALDTVRELRSKVVRARREHDERDDLIEALDKDRGVKDEKIDLFGTALGAALLETEAEQEAHAFTKDALAASEKRADKLEAAVMKDRRKKILIGVGSATGGILIAFGATYAATRVQ